jgi:hypothetical protein
MKGQYRGIFGLNIFTIPSLIIKYSGKEIALDRPSRIPFSISCLIMYFNNDV